MLAEQNATVKPTLFSRYFEVTLVDSVVVGGLIAETGVFAPVTGFEIDQNDRQTTTKTTV